MKIGIIGAGFVGLSASEALLKDHQVTIIEKNSIPGGLAKGFKKRNWKWSLEDHYHHWFTSDNYALETAKRINHKVLTVRPKTSVLYNDKSYPFDSPVSLLSFPGLTMFDKARVGATIAILKLTPIWQPLEKISAVKFANLTMGPRAWKLLWEPLFKGKFGVQTGKIPASWFWARIKKRTPLLCYPQMGFQAFAERYEKYLTKQGVVLLYNEEVHKITKSKNKIVVFAGEDKYEFDKVICTLPFSFFSKVTKGLPSSYARKLGKLEGVGAISLILVLKHKLLTDGTYWLNINDLSYPFLAIVEHTNFMSKNNYGKSHIVYVGNYLPSTHSFFTTEPDKLLDLFVPYLKKINKSFNKNWVKSIHISKSPFAQPVVTKNYSKKLPGFSTPIDGLYVANIQQVYPWDRGTNYAIEIGQEVAKHVL